MPEDIRGSSQTTSIHVRATNKGIELYTDQVYWLLKRDVAQDLLTKLASQIETYDGMTEDANDSNS